MINFYIGLICFSYSIFLLFFSPKEKNNILGYKSFQQYMHKDIWKWTNKCFGLLVLFGSVIYLGFSILELLEIFSFANLKKYGLYFIVFSFVATECFAFVKRIKFRSQ